MQINPHKPVLARTWSAPADQVIAAMPLLPTALGLVLSRNNYRELIPWCRDNNRPYVLDLARGRGRPSSVPSIIPTLWERYQHAPTHVIIGENEPNGTWKPGSTKTRLTPSEAVQLALTDAEIVIGHGFEAAMAQTKTVGNWWSHILGTRQLDVDYIAMLQAQLDTAGLEEVMIASGAGRSGGKAREQARHWASVIEHIPENQWTGWTRDRKRGNTMYNWLRWLRDDRDATALMLDGSVTIVKRNPNHDRFNHYWGLTRNGRLTRTGRDLSNTLIS